MSSLVEMYWKHSTGRIRLINLELCIRISIGFSSHRLLCMALPPNTPKMKRKTISSEQAQWNSAISALSAPNSSIKSIPRISKMKTVNSSQSPMTSLYSSHSCSYPVDGSIKFKENFNISTTSVLAWTTITIEAAKWRLTARCEDKRNINVPKDS